ncbi:MAG: CRTAC1 family protein [Acidobacteriota bacterium]|nr:MAG: CRTAC1 family protein [Acidobacteriota bacterium]
MTSARESSGIREWQSAGSRFERYVAYLLSWLLLIVLIVIPAASHEGADTGVVFTDVTKSSGITFKHAYAPEKRYIVESMSGGVALFDFDRDGRLDIYLVNSLTVASADNPRSARSELWRNNGDGTFIDVTEKAGVGYPGWGMGVATGDFDNDGWEDLYVTCFGPNRLYRNNGDGTFSDIAVKAGVSDSRWSTGAAFGDYDNDGRLDLFVANYVDLKLDALPEFGKGKNCQFQGMPVQCGPQGLKGSGDSLFHNNGDGTFTDVSRQAGVDDKELLFGLGSVWCDFNEDGRIDLYVANDTGANYLYQNNGDGTFSEIGLMSGAALSEDGKGQASMGVAIGDFDHRGRSSIFVTNFSDEYNAFYRHEKGFTFTDVSYATQTGRASLPYVGWGCGFFDYDNDGWLDLLAVNGHVYPQLETAKLKIAYAQRKLLYRNNRNGTFVEIGAEAGSSLSEPSVSRGAAFGDLDNDGDVDVVINNLDGAPVILRNDGGNRNNFLVIELIGSKSGHDAYGARVKVTAGDFVQVAEKRSGGSYLSQNDSRLHFGLEQRTKVDAVEVRWPGGAVQKLTSPSANSLIRIVEQGSER